MAGRAVTAAFYVTTPEDLDPAQVHAAALCAQSRAGLADLGWGGFHHWESRHSGAHRDGVGAPACSVSQGNPAWRCQCGRRGAQCCEHMSAEDLLCEPCRRWCLPGLPG